MKLGIFGGTFNPIHQGHITAALKFYDAARLDKMLVIPDRIPPHKEGNVASAEDRTAMLNIVFGNSDITDGRNIEVSDMEIKREGKSYTVITLRALKAVYPDCSLFLYTGSDMFRTLESWYCGDEILGLCSVVTTARQHGEREELVSIAAQYREKYGTECLVMDYEPIELSSTEVRGMISDCGRENFREFTKKLLTDDVAKYIMENNLYRD